MKITDYGPATYLVFYSLSVGDVIYVLLKNLLTQKEIVDYVYKVDPLRKPGSFRVSVRYLNNLNITNAFYIAFYVDPYSKNAIQPHPSEDML